MRLSKFMKNKDLLNAINDIDDKYIQETQHRPAKKHRFVKAGIAAACFCVLAGGILILKNFRRTPDGTVSGIQSDFVIAKASYPERIQFPNADFGNNEDIQDSDIDSYFDLQKQWTDSYYKRIRLSENYVDALYPFYKTTMNQFLVSETHENRVYSPLNLYIALSMLAESTDKESRSQILSLLNADNIDVLRESIPALWEANYTDDGAVTSILANSLWLRDDIRYNPSTLQNFADLYRASSFYGDMASEKFTLALQDWLSEQTGGLLNEQANQIRFTPDTVLALASTIYFRAKWNTEFYSSKTEEGVFHAASEDTACSFMKQSGNRPYFYGNHFSAVYQELKYSGGMWLILPDEGKTVNDLVTDEQVLEMVQAKHSWENQVERKVNLSMPKFDIVSDMDLSKHLKALGITDVFYNEISDFSPITTEIDKIFVSSARHAARVTVDEDGCTATAFTIMAMNGAGMPVEKEEIDFILDRPFLFIITSSDNSILFAGVVEQP